MEHEGWSSIIPSLLECPHVIVFEWLDEEIVETVIASVAAGKSFD